MHTEDPMEVSTSIPDTVEELLQQSSPFHVSALQLRLSTTGRFAGNMPKSCQGEKARATLVKAAERLLASNSMSGAITVEDVLQRHEAIHAVQFTLRDFHYNRRHWKESQTTDLRNKMVQDHLVSWELWFVSGRVKANEKAPDTVIVCLGTSGTGIDSRLKGHARLDGEQIRKRHRCYLPVAMTNECISSQTCSTCFNPITHPRVIHGRWKTVLNNGPSLCMNSACPSYRDGKNTRNHDVEGAECIAIAAASRLLTGSTIACFDQSSQYYTGQHFLFYRDPSLTGTLASKLSMSYTFSTKCMLDATQVPVPMGIR